MLKDNIAVVAFNGISPLHLSVPCAVFGEDRRGAGVPQFKVVVCGVERGTLATSAGFSLTGLHGLGELEKAGIIIVPSWHDPNELPPQHLLRHCARPPNGVRLWWDYASAATFWPQQGCWMVAALPPIGPGPTTWQAVTRRSMWTGMSSMWMKGR